MELSTARQRSGAGVRGHPRGRLLVLVGCVSLIVIAFVATLTSSSRPALGLDLRGGASVVLQPVSGSDLSQLETAVSVIRSRVDGLGISEATVARQGNNIVVELPGAKNQAAALQLVGETAELRFRPVLGTLPYSLPPTAHPPAHATAPTSCRDGALVTPPAKDIATSPVILADHAHTLCYELGPTILTGKNIQSATATLGASGGWVVQVHFGNDDFVQLVASRYTNQQVAISLDQTVESAPTIRPGITGRNVEISGTFGASEARTLALALRYGSLPVHFTPATSEQVSATLGADQLRAGVAAGLFGLGLVALYMLGYYRLLGLVVVAGIGLTAMALFVTVSWLSTHAGLSLTLAGVTGLIVSVGVTVDSYVVYFERLKDEVHTGRSVRQSTGPASHQAARTIVAADCVALLSAVVLYLFAAGSVRGFAYFLGLSTLLDLLLAYCFMFPTVSLLARRRSLVTLPGVGLAHALDSPTTRT